MELTQSIVENEIDAKRVRYVWKMSRETYKQAQRLKIENWYPWEVDFKFKTAGKFYGFQIQIVDDGTDLELCAVLPDGLSVIELEGEIPPRQNVR